MRKAEESRGSFSLLPCLPQDIITAAIHLKIWLRSSTGSQWNPENHLLHHIGILSV